jgi:hypothetical protein
MVSGKFSLIATPVKGLNLTGNIGLMNENSRYNALYSQFGSSSSTDGQAYVSHDRYFAVNSQLLAEYKTDFGGTLHNLEVLAGYELYKLKIQNLEGQNDHLYDPFIGELGNADGTSSILVQNTSTNTYHLWNNNDITFATWAWGGSGSIGAVEADWEVAGIGDFQGDGIDDIIVMNNKTGYMFAWENGNSSKTRWVGAVDAGDWEVAAVGDYNGDGKDDLLLRELVTGWGGLGYWGAGYAGNWVDLNARVENNQISNFAVIA